MLRHRRLRWVKYIRLGRKIEWDGESMTAPNAPEASEIVKRSYNKAWDTFA